MYVCMYIVNVCKIFTNELHFFLNVCSLDFIGRPVIIEVPHFASLRGKEREIVILRSDNGDTWREHTLDASEEAVQDVLNESFEGEGKVFLIFIVILC